MAYTFTGTMVNLGYGRGWLDAPAAASQFRIDRALGHPQQITEAGRTYAEQMAHWLNYQRYGSPIALHPDTPSLHQKGNAKDTDERLTALMNEHGWYHTVYRWVNGVWTLVEPWHYEYFYDRDTHRNETASDGSTAFPMEDDMPTLFEVFHTPITKGPDGNDITLANFMRYSHIWGAQQTWRHALSHPLAKDAAGKPVAVPAGDLLRYEPAEHGNTRAAVASLTGTVSALQEAVGAIGQSLAEVQAILADLDEGQVDPPKA